MTPQFLEALRRGEPEAFYQLVTGHTGRLRDYVSRWLDRREDAEEAVQEVFLYIWENRQLLDRVNIRKGYEYIYTAAKFQAIRIIREKKRFERYSGQVRYFPEGLADSPADLIISKQQEEKIERIVEEMPETRGMVFKMKYREGISDETIARTLNISPVTVRRHISLAKEDIRKVFSELYL